MTARPDIGRVARNLPPILYLNASRFEDDEPHKSLGHCVAVIAAWLSGRSTLKVPRIIDRDEIYQTLAFIRREMSRRRVIILLDGGRSGSRPRPLRGTLRFRQRQPRQRVDPQSSRADRDGKRPRTDSRSARQLEARAASAQAGHPEPHPGSHDRKMVEIQRLVLKKR
jgi:hypothetical protein